MYQLVITLVGCGLGFCGWEALRGLWGALAGLPCVADPTEKGEPETRGIQHQLSQVGSLSWHSDMSVHRLTDLECQN